MVDRIKCYRDAAVKDHFTLDINVFPKYLDFDYYKGNHLK